MPKKGTKKLVFCSALLLMAALILPSCCTLHFPDYEVRVVDQETKKPIAHIEVEVEWKGCSWGGDACYPYNAGEQTYLTDKDGRVLLPSRTFMAKGIMDTESQMWWHPKAKEYSYNAVLYFMDPESQKSHYETQARYLKSKGKLPPEYDGQSVTIYMQKWENPMLKRMQKAP